MKYLRIECEERNIEETIDFAWVMYETVLQFSTLSILVISNKQETLRVLNARARGRYYACTEKEEVEMFFPSWEPKKNRAEIKIGSRIVMSKETDCLVVHNRPDNQLDEILSQANEAGIKVVWAQSLSDAEFLRELFIVRKEISLKERQVVIITFNSFMYEKTLATLTFQPDEEEGVVRVMQGRGGSPDEEFELFRLNKARQDFALSSIDWYLRDKFPNARVEEKVVTATTASFPPARQEYRAETKKTAVSRSRTGEFEKRVVKVKQRYRQVRKPL